MNVTVIPVSSTSIGVSWDPPPLEDQNGIITGFSLNYSSVRLLAEGTFQLNFTEGMLIVGGLEEFEEYNFTVAAETESGLGPSSVVLSAVTFEDGMFNLYKKVDYIVVLGQTIRMWSLQIILYYLQTNIGTIYFSLETF